MCGPYEFLRTYGKAIASFGVPGNYTLEELYGKSYSIQYLPGLPVQMPYMIVVAVVII